MYNVICFLNFLVFYIQNVYVHARPVSFCMSQGHTLSTELSTASSRTWTLSSICHSWYSSHRPFGCEL